MTEEIDLAIVGAGAAGLMTAIWAARAAPGHRVVCLDGAARLGAKILIAGGGRCNVTHDVVDERAFAGGSPNAIRKVLRRFDVPETVAFFAELGVTLVREETGKLFPTTDRARTVLDALVGAARTAGVELRHPWRVETIAPSADGLVVAGPAGALAAAHVVLATGGRSVPKTGSDGHGYALVRALGHTVTHTFPALVPLTLAEGHALRALRGVAADVTLGLRTVTGKRLLGLGGSLLCTHTGLSGPVVLDMSRHWRAAVADDPSVELVVDWVPALGRDGLDALLLASGSAGPVRRLHAHLPERLARALCEQAGVDGSAPALALTRAARRTLVETVTAFVLPVTGDRGFDHAEVTAGGVPLTEIRLETMASRVQPGLHLVGEICDVDGRIGGYNFQWAWATGYVAGNAIGAALAG